MIELSLPRIGTRGVRGGDKNPAAKYAEVYKAFEPDAYLRARSDHTRISRLWASTSGRSLARKRANVSVAGRAGSKTIRILELRSVAPVVDGGTGVAPTQMNGVGRARAPRASRAAVLRRAGCVRRRGAGRRRLRLGVREGA
jgi:hypothetical protein